MQIARMARIATGSTLVVAGTAMLVLPGPGVLTIAAGVHLLSRDVPVAARVKAWSQRKLAERREK
jgi:hypothetical protein